MTAAARSSKSAGRRWQSKVSPARTTDVRAGAARRAQDAGEPGRAVAAMQPRRVVMIDVQIGAVNDHDVPGRRGQYMRHGRRTYPFERHWQPNRSRAGSTDRFRHRAGYVRLRSRRSAAPAATCPRVIPDFAQVGCFATLRRDGSWGVSGSVDMSSSNVYRTMPRTACGWPRRRRTSVTSRSGSPWRSRGCASPSIRRAAALKFQSRSDRAWAGAGR